ncbi:MAG TPA: UDP-N-acetylmuramoyl-L-alanyl-D-glutamate--2,6-diaminopimelate ligase [Gaiellaceae bacterium]|nr:UDP-N-acetylmuramoyl-L-alanyl-D-glutamate--2,6-diaminopimelate ligase [Gaiellaceae bacterium]
MGDDQGRRPRLLESRGIELETLSQAVGAVRIVNPAPAEIHDLAYDARLVTPGALFACVRGRRADGHDFAGAAVAGGAAALLVERELPLAVPQLVVDDARAAMALAADAFFGHPTRELEVAGVTGTNGKTTTAFLLYSILAAAGRRPGLLGTVESRIGGERRAVVRTTPEAIDLQRTFREMLDSGDRSCAMEASSHGSELKRLLGVRFAVLVFTNLSQDHLDLHGTMEAYFDAKRRLFTEPDPDGRRPPAAVNVGDEHGRLLARELAPLGGRVLTFGLADDAEVRAEALELTPAGTTFVADGLALRPRLRGRFNVENVLGAVAAARLLGVTDEAIVRGVEHVAGVPGRFEAVDEGQAFAVLVDYAHTPEALENVLGEARSLAEGRVVCVFGCGGDRDRAKRPLMGGVVSRLADRAIVTSDNPRSEDPLAIIDEILMGMDGTAEVEPDRAAAIALAIEEARDGDVVVIAGKGHEQGQEFAGRTIPFDDREVAREALRRSRAAA